MTGIGSFGIACAQNFKSKLARGPIPTCLVGQRAWLRFVEWGADCGDANREALEAQVCRYLVVLVLYSSRGFRSSLVRSLVL